MNLNFVLFRRILERFQLLDQMHRATVPSHASSHCSSPARRDLSPTKCRERVPSGPFRSPQVPPELRAQFDAQRFPFASGPFFRVVFSRFSLLSLLS